MGSLLSNKTRTPEINILGVGTHTVTIQNMYQTDDQHKTVNGPAVPKQGWIDPTDQIAFVFVSKDGVCTHRQACIGHVRYSELSTKDQITHDCIYDVDEAGNIIGNIGYAVNKKTKMRIEDPTRTNRCFNFLDDMAARCGLPEGSEYREMTGEQLTITITKNERGNLRVTKTEKVAAAEQVLD